MILVLKLCEVIDLGSLIPFFHLMLPFWVS